MLNSVSCRPVSMTFSKSCRWLCASISRHDGDWVVNVLPGLYEYREEAWAVAVANDCHVLGVKFDPDGTSPGFVEGMHNPASGYSMDMIIFHGLGSLSYEVHRCLKSLSLKGSL